MLKLTNNMDGAYPVYILASAIIGFERFGSGCTSVHTGRYCFTVKETPEQIMAMPEMQYHLFPSMTIDKDLAYALR